MSLKKLVEEITKPVIDEMGIVASDGTIKGGSYHSKIKKMRVTLMDPCPAVECYLNTHQLLEILTTLIF